MARAIHAGYYDGRARAGQVRRLHILRETGRWAGRQAMCGQGAYPVTHSTPVVLDPMPPKPPDGLAWCPKCVGLLAEHLDVLDRFATELATTSTEETT